ncbi:hypothetical protein BN7_3599 [Wickerhamomyces ciferrii]|uniref:Uncharacterized protein n=1 Tax=Wickerhamomyces ciferrii (strain ATCC 14091 / BCRC 22168 / CBS 111 / JCM 3599 / NBRC 0793 / NRRL Y-1031 F-60-10) TaxID=1206466 RepID=K0KFV5_WICCF|nr:uncharacterized protein BN7_3599 [Wickerhamomyces ciferrii]CCH44040.1 hypothetical protein BN7_3599 [Wickerhamomyces ciferrii]
MVSALTDFDYDLTGNAILMEDTIDNMQFCFVESSLYEFKLQELFKIRQKDKLNTECDYYLDIKDTEKFDKAISYLRLDFCTPNFPLIIKDEEYGSSDKNYIQIIRNKVKLMPGKEYPEFILGMWYIAFDINLLINWLPYGSTSNQNVHQSQSKFSRAFKLIEFEDIKELRKEDFKANIYQLEYFIKKSLMKFNRKELIRMLEILLMDYKSSNINSCRGKANDDEVTRESILRSDLKYNIVKPLLNFLFELINVHFDEGSHYRFSQIDSDKILIETPSQVWNKISGDIGENYPSDLVDYQLFENTKDMHIVTKLKSRQDLSFNCFGIETMTNPHLFGKLDPSNKFKDLNAVFRESSQHLIRNRLSRYMVTDLIEALYFELPVSTDGYWSGKDDPDHVVLKKAPLKYLYFDNSKVREPETLSFQCLIALQVFEQIKKIISENIISYKEVNCHDADYRNFDESTDENYNKFILELMKNGFKKKQEITKASINREFNSPSHNIRSKTQKRVRLNPNYTDNLFNLKIQMETENFEILEGFAYASSLKLFLSSKEFLNKITIRNQYQDDQLSDQVFCKIYDLFQMPILFRNSKIISWSEDTQYEKLDQIQKNILYSLEDNNIKDLNEWINDMKGLFFQEIIALKKIEDWNSINDEQNQINTAKLLQYGWFDDLTLGDKYSLFGPFLILEKIDFINDNKISSFKRKENFRKQIELLKKAGISHEDLSNKYNYCFNQNEECFIVDFGMSTVDDVSFLDNVFDKISFWPPEA